MQIIITMKVTFYHPWYLKKDTINGFINNSTTILCLIEELQSMSVSMNSGFETFVKFVSLSEQC